jgi:hypothetical protein
VCETWSPILKEELRLRVFENWVLRKVSKFLRGRTLEENGENYIMRHFMTCITPHFFSMIKQRK